MGLFYYYFGVFLYMVPDKYFLNQGCVKEIYKVEQK